MARTETADEGRSSKSLPLPKGVTAEDVHKQLERILCAKTFIRSQRLSDFLRYVVEKGLKGSLDELKETTLAMDVFGRPADFEPKLDPIVRVEAGRLRSKIREYYETGGQEDWLWVGLAKRGYRPVVRQLAPKPRTQSAESSEESGPKRFSLAILPIEDLSIEEELIDVCKALTDQLIHSLAMDGSWEVAARTSIRRYRDQPADAREIAEHVRVSYLLEGSLQPGNDHLELRLRLLDAASGLTTWADTFEEPSEDLSEVQNAFARRTVEALRAIAKSKPEG